ncbi:MAG: hypothetical protein V1851_02825 [Patescibacteria group bacterium]
METIKAVIVKMNQQIIAPIILLLFVLSLVYFFWGVAKYIKNSASDTSRAEGQEHMLWGIVGIFIMASAWAIIKIIANSIGAPEPTVLNGLGL